MATITIVGIGPGPVKYLTKEAEAALLGADKVFFRTAAHPVYVWLKEAGKPLHSFDPVYTLPWKNVADRYDFMVAALFKEASLRPHVVYAVPGSAMVLEDTTELIRARGERDDVEVRVVAGLSFLDLALDAVRLDTSAGLQVVLPLMHLDAGRFTSRLGLMVCQIEASPHLAKQARVDVTRDLLLKTYPPDHQVTLIWTDGFPEYATHSQPTALKDLVDAYGHGKLFTSLYVPPVN